MCSKNNNYNHSFWNCVAKPTTTTTSTITLLKLITAEVDYKLCNDVDLVFNHKETRISSKCINVSNGINVITNTCHVCIYFSASVYLIGSRSAQLRDNVVHRKA